SVSGARLDWRRLRALGSRAAPAKIPYWGPCKPPVHSSPAAEETRAFYTMADAPNLPKWPDRGLSPHELRRGHATSTDRSGVPVLRGADGFDVPDPALGCDPPVPASRPLTAVSAIHLRSY